MITHLHALAMRTKAAEQLTDAAKHWRGERRKSRMGAYSDLCDKMIHVCVNQSSRLRELPLEADHEAILEEALRLPEIAALIADLTIMRADGHYEGCGCPCCTRVDAFLAALETP